MTKLQDIEEAMRRADSPIQTTTSLADSLDVSSETVRQDLKLLEREGAVESRKVGAHAIAWWHVDRVSDPIVPAAEHPDQSALEESVEQRDDVQEASGRDRDAGAGETPERLAASAVDVPGQGDKAQRRREAVEAVLAALRDRGPMDAGDLRAIGFEAADVGYADSNSFWKNCLNPALGELRDRDVVALVDRARGRWDWEATDE